MRAWNTASIGTAIFGTCLAALGAFIVVETGSMPAGPSYAAVGPRAFPGFIGAALILVGLVQLRAAFKAAGIASESTAYDWRAVGWMCVALIVPISLLEVLGWVPAATMTFMAVARAFRSSKPLIDACIGLVLASGTLLLFNQVLGLELPIGSALSAFVSH